jgi:hypothetical protein
VYFVSFLPFVVILFDDYYCLICFSFQSLLPSPIFLSFYLFLRSYDFCQRLAFIVPFRFAHFTPRYHSHTSYCSPLNSLTLTSSYDSNSVLHFFLFISPTQLYHSGNGNGGQEGMKDMRYSFRQDFNTDSYDAKEAAVSEYLLSYFGRYAHEHDEKHETAQLVHLPVDEFWMLGNGRFDHLLLLFITLWCHSVLPMLAEFFDLHKYIHCFTILYLTYSSRTAYGGYVVAYFRPFFFTLIDFVLIFHSISLFIFPSISLYLSFISLYFPILVRGLPMGDFGFEVEEVDALEGLCEWESGQGFVEVR